MEPNRRCSVQRPGSTVLADGRDSGSASRFPTILRFSRMTPDRAIAIALAFQMFPNAWRLLCAMAASPFPLKRFPFWLSAMGSHPVPTHRGRPDPDEARSTAPSRRSGSAAVAAQRREKRDSASSSHGLALFRWFLLDSSSTREWLALPIGLFGNCPYRPFGNARNRHAVQWWGSEQRHSNHLPFHA